MIVDNIELIEPLLKFDKKGQTCFMVQIMQRKKDGNEVKVHGSNRNRTVKTYHFYTKEYFELKKEEIREICEFFNARAYININPKPLMSILFKLSQMITDTIKTMWHGDHPMSLVGLVDSAIAQTVAKKSDDTWVIDIDEEEMPFVDDIMEIVTRAKSDFNENIIAELPTVSGKHFITHRFDCRELIEKYPKEGLIKRNSNTLLYANV